jgi:hypothetical protein
MRAQVAQGERPPQPVQRVRRMRRQHEAHPHQQGARVPGRHAAEDREVGVAVLERVRPMAEHGFHHVDARVGALGTEALEAAEQQPGREDHLDGEADLGLPPGRQAPGRGLDGGRLVEHETRAADQEIARRRQHRLAPAHDEGLHAEERLHLLHRIRDGRLALVQRSGRLRIAAGVHHGHERAPLVERDAGIHIG